MKMNVAWVFSRQLKAMLVTFSSDVRKVITESLRGA